MRVLNEKLCADILETGRKEFLALGYRDASLRHIAASLGVTTGAIYRYYADKEALFDALVAQPAQELADRYRAVQQTFAQQSVEEQVRNLPEVPDEEAGWMLDFIYDHFDAFKLIACCAGGTKYEHYLDTLAEIEDMLAIPGVTSLQHLEAALRDLIPLGVRHVMTCFDMDYLKNWHVENAYRNLVALLGKQDITFGTYLWVPDHNGLDDYIWEFCMNQGKAPE